MIRACVVLKCFYTQYDVYYYLANKIKNKYRISVSYIESVSFILIPLHS